jgi:hypothetical protein
LLMLVKICRRFILCSSDSFGSSGLGLEKIVH